MFSSTRITQMARLGQNRSDHVADFGSQLEKFPSFRQADSISANNHGGAVLRLVWQAAEFLRSAEDHSIEVETRARALADRADDELKEAKTRIRSLELDCDRLNTLCAQAEDRALAAEGALSEAKVQISAMEAQLSNAELRASEAEGSLIQVEDAIRKEILNPHRASSMTAAA